MVKPARLKRQDGCGEEDVSGIVILDGGVGVRVDRAGPRIHPFVYGDRIPPVPTLPFGRWKAAS